MQFEPNLEAQCNGTSRLGPYFQADLTSCSPKGCKNRARLVQVSVHPMTSNPEIQGDPGAREIQGPGGGARRFRRQGDPGARRRGQEAREIQGPGSGGQGPPREIQGPRRSRGQEEGPRSGQEDEEEEARPGDCKGGPGLGRAIVFPCPWGQRDHTR